MIVAYKDDVWCEVVFSPIDSKNLNICVKNSYKIKYSDDIENLLKIICNNPAFSELTLPRAEAPVALPPQAGRPLPDESLPTPFQGYTPPLF